MKWINYSRTFSITRNWSVICLERIPHNSIVKEKLKKEKQNVILITDKVIVPRSLCGKPIQHQRNINVFPGIFQASLSTPDISMHLCTNLTSTGMEIKFNFPKNLMQYVNSVLPCQIWNIKCEKLDCSHCSFSKKSTFLNFESVIWYFRYNGPASSSEILYDSIIYPAPNVFTW